MAFLHKAERHDIVLILIAQYFIPAAVLEFGIGVIVFTVTVLEMVIW